MQVGIVSAVTLDTLEISSPGPDVVFQSEIEALQADVDALTAQGVSMIIALTHVGLPDDIRIAEAVSGIDVIVGGHSHTYLSATDPEREGPYPLWVDGPGNMMVAHRAGLCLFQRYLGHLGASTFDDAGAVIFADGNTMLLDASVEPDADDCRPDH